MLQSSNHGKFKTNSSTCCTHSARRRQARRKRISSWQRSAMQRWQRDEVQNHQVIRQRVRGPEEVAVLTLRAELMVMLRKLIAIRGWTQAHAADTVPVVRALVRMLAMRAYQREKHVDGRIDFAALQQIGINQVEVEVEVMYHVPAIALRVRPTNYCGAYRRLHGFDRTWAESGRFARPPKRRRLRSRARSSGADSRCPAASPRSSSGRCRTHPGSGRRGGHPPARARAGRRHRPANRA